MVEAANLRRESIDLEALLLSRTYLYLSLIHISEPTRPY